MSKNMKVWFGDLNFDTFLLISQGLLQIFKNRFLRWNRELKPVVLSTMNPINGSKIFLSYKGVCRILKSRTPQLKPIKIENYVDFLKTYVIYHYNKYQPNRKFDFFNFPPTLTHLTINQFACHCIYWKIYLSGRVLCKHVSQKFWTPSLPRYA